MFQHQKFIQYSLRAENMNDQKQLNANVIQNICSTY